MTLPFGVNSEPFPLQRMIAVAGGKVSGVDVAVATLPASNYLRFIKRIFVVTSLTSADMGTPSGWSDVLGDVTFRIQLGDLYSGAVLDMTAFGSVNSNEYLHSIPIPINTPLLLVWFDVKPASAVKCTANLTLDELP